MYPPTLNLDGPKISIAAGIIVGLLASFVQSLGLTIQRKSHIQNQELPEDEQKNEYRRPYVFASAHLLDWRISPSRPQVVVAWFRSATVDPIAQDLLAEHSAYRHIHILKHSRFAIPDSIATRRYSCAPRCRFIVMECVLRPFATRGRILRVDDPRYYPNRQWRGSNRSIWNRPRTDTLLGRSSCSV